MCPGVDPGGWTSWSRRSGTAGIAKSHVLRMAKVLDAEVEAFRTRTLDYRPYTDLWLDALTQRERQGKQWPRGRWRRISHRSSPRRHPRRRHLYLAQGLSHQIVAAAH